MDEYRQHYPGFFVVIEGGDGAGKTTQAKQLASRLETLGLKVLLTWEPGGTVVAEEIRKIVLDEKNSSISKRAEALLFAAGRADHVENRILPALKEGKVVICDRYIDSSVAYQGKGRKLGARLIRKISEWAAMGVLPDLIILLDVSVNVDNEQVLSRVTNPNRIDKEATEFHAMVVKALRESVQQAQNHLIVDACFSEEEIQVKIFESVSEKLKEKNIL